MSGSKPLRTPRRRKPDHTADLTKVAADARAKIDRIKADAFTARLEAIDAILQDAEPYDVLLLARRPSRVSCRSAARRMRTNSERSFCGFSATALPRSGTRPTGKGRGATT